MMDDVLRKKLFHHADTRPPLLSSNHAPQWEREREIIFCICYLLRKRARLWNKMKIVCESYHLCESLYMHAPPRKKKAPPPTPNVTCLAVPIQLNNNSPPSHTPGVVAIRTDPMQEDGGNMTE
jgi:hypothetical protein